MSCQYVLSTPLVGVRRVLLLALLLTAPMALPAQEAADSGDIGWPRLHAFGNDSFTIYQPQSDSWNGNQYTGHAAVAVKGIGQPAPVYGVMWFTARTDVDKDNRMVYFEDFVVTKGHFPSAADQTGTFVWELQQVMPATLPIALDRVETDLAISQAQMKNADAAVKNTPPQVIFSVVPAMLVLIDGKPVLRDVEGVKGVQRVLNTSALLLTTGGKYYVHVFDGWMQAVALDSSWTVSGKPPKGLNQAMAVATKAGPVNLMEGASPDSTQPKPSLAKGPVPVIFISLTPAELIVTDGPPDYVPIDGTNLLYASNTTGRLFKDIVDQNTYVLLSGRWFRAPSLSGPWTWVPGTQLPSDFRNIPDTSPVENVLASVPGTQEAQEAMIANSIPQTATIKRAGTTIAPHYDGQPELEPIEGTSLQYVDNASIPVIQTGANSYYAVQNGVWFVSSTLQGPWLVAASVPVAIYTIPPSSPLYYVTYVQVYSATPEVVYVGYTPGYYGTVVSGGVVVYGTGYIYPAWIGTVYYPPPVTYGMAVAIRYTPWTGWGIGFGFGWGAVTVGWGGCCWGPTPYYGAYYGSYYGYRGVAYGAYGGATAWGPGGWASTTGNVYSHWGSASAVTRSSAGYNAYTGNAWSNQVGRSYNSATGVLAAGQRSSVENAYTGNYQDYAGGVARNTQTGVVAAGEKTTVGNAYTGQSVTAARGGVYDPRTGQATTVAGVSGDQGSAVRVGNNVYADQNGNIYKNDSDNDWEPAGGHGGGHKDKNEGDLAGESKHGSNDWQQYSSNGGWNRASQQQADSWNNDSQARQLGNTRADSFRGWQGGGGGGFRGGGFRR